MVAMRHLELHNSQLTSAGLVRLHQHDPTEGSSLTDTRVEDLSPIGHLTKLKSLWLSGSPIDDAGLAAVARFGELERSLDLQDDKI